MRLVRLTVRFRAYSSFSKYANSSGNKVTTNFGLTINALNQSHQREDVAYDVLHKRIGQLHHNVDYPSQIHVYLMLLFFVMQIQISCCTR